MSTDERFVNPMSADQPWTNLLLPTGRDRIAGATPAAGEDDPPTIDPQQRLPMELIEAWSRWAASHLS